MDPPLLPRSERRKPWSSSPNFRSASPRTSCPREFFDTLGAIQESAGQPLVAEQSYLDGLKRPPENPVLNFHLGKLLAADRSRSHRAKLHLSKALAARDQLRPSMVLEADDLVRTLGGGIKAN